jgi:hypothetical protein
VSEPNVYGPRLDVSILADHQEVQVKVENFNASSNQNTRVCSSTVTYNTVLSMFNFMILLQYTRIVYKMLSSFSGIC